MRKRFLIAVAVAVVGGLLGMQPAYAACDTGGDNPRNDGNEVAGVYVEHIPVDGDVGGQEIRTDRAWVEVQDDSEYLPVNVDVGWQGGRTPSAGPVPGIIGFVVCTDAPIEGVMDELP